MKPDPDEKRATGKRNAGDERPSLRRLARNPGASSRVENLDIIPARRDVEDELAGKHLVRLFLRDEPQAALVRPFEIPAADNPGRQVSDLAESRALQGLWIRSAGPGHRREDFAD